MSYVRVLPYKMASAGLNELKSAYASMFNTDVHRMYKYSETPACVFNQIPLNKPNCILSWGKSIYNSAVNDQPALKRNLFILNGHHDIMETSKNKLKFLQFYSRYTEEFGLQLPEWKTSRESSLMWFNDEKSKIVSRQLLTSHSGRGITISRINQIVPIVPLYTRYIPKKDEYRVHFFKFGNDPVSNQPLFTYFIQKKKSVFDGVNSALTPDSRFQIRNHDNGWIYSRENVNAPMDVVSQALKFISVTPLDFGAIDIIYNQRQDMSYILEVNTAPGLQGKTGKDYAHILNYMLRNHDSNSVGYKFKLKPGFEQFVPYNHTQDEVIVENILGLDEEDTL